MFIATMKPFCCLLSAAVFGVFACLYGLRADRGLQDLLGPRNRSPPATSLLPFVSGLPLYLHQSEGSEDTPLGGEERNCEPCVGEVED
ncbi:hypothetical protein Zm00014a_008780 [Zea mays]|uniref:Uncharacterized protein n=1 Tax=Zea mays TaxID=4577 RepID=A0A3L6DLV1_MAIZE|nr:hypothetical protein Zm00014a_008780 [Zea mays]